MGIQYSNKVSPSLKHLQLVATALPFSGLIVRPALLVIDQIMKFSDLNKPAFNISIKDTLQ